MGEVGEEKSDAESKVVRDDQNETETKSEKAPSESLIPTCENKPESQEGQMETETKPTETKPVNMASFWQSRWKPKLIVRDGQFCKLDNGYQTVFYGSQLD